MYDYIIDEMTDAVTKELGVTGAPAEAEIRERFRLALSKCWESRIAVIWTVDDIRTMLSDLGRPDALTEDEMHEVLIDLHNDFDASIGISWTEIELAVQEAVDRKNPQEEDDDEYCQDAAGAADTTESNA